MRAEWDPLARHGGTKEDGSRPASERHKPEQAIRNDGERRTATVAIAALQRLWPQLHLEVSSTPITARGPLVRRDEGQQRQASQGIRTGEWRDKRIVADQVLDIDRWPTAARPPNKFKALGIHIAVSTSGGCGSVLLCHRTGDSATDWTFENCAGRHVYWLLVFPNSSL
jgi:hypothetical protein